MIICSVLFALAAAAQEQSSPDSVRLQENKHTLMGGIRQVQHYLDEKARAKVDSHYIEVPGKPWSVILRYNANGFRLDYDSHIDFPGTNESADWQLCFEPPMASSYMFNGRRYSQAAAYSQSVIQRRSAGSLLVGATWYQSSLDFSEPENFAFMLLSDYTGCIKVQQANLGVGYGYNFVPFRGFIVNAMVMPTVSVYNLIVGRWVTRPSTVCSGSTLTCGWALPTTGEIISLAFRGSSITSPIRKTRTRSPSSTPMREPH